jgi:type IV pilus assembly protein PilQ
MKKLVLGSVGTLFLFAVSTVIPAFAAELLDVNPVTSGSGVVIEVTADIPMTYTYYKVPGQARAVVDIADADPEKVEPLIVVNKGAVSSISVDKAMIADMTVSRLVFNLVAESDIFVKHDADRKKLIVSFGGGAPVAAETAPKVVPPAPVAAAAPPVSPVKEVEKAAEKPAEKPVVTSPAPANSLSKEEDDPLGLDDPKPVAVSTTAPAITPAYAAVRSEKIEPVVSSSDDQASSKAVVKGIVIGSSFIDIQAFGNVDKIKHIKLTQPDRLAIDIPGVSTITAKKITVNKFGIAKVRIGTNPGVVRIVLDASRSPFPAYSVAFTESGVRVNFK